jgi:hypothetical protein
MRFKAGMKVMLNIQELKKTFLDREGNLSMEITDVMNKIFIIKKIHPYFPYPIELVDFRFPLKEEEVRIIYGLSKRIK